MSLHNQRVIIIGGSSGIGLATAKAAVAAGAIVTIASRSEQKIEHAKQQMDGQVKTAMLDLTQEETVRALFEQIGAVDHLVITGSSVQLGPFREMDTIVAHKSMESKFWGPYRAAKYARLNPSGSIVLFSGVLSHRPTPGSVILAAINAGVEGLGRALAVELAPIRVNVVCPGLVATPLYDKMPQAQREGMYHNTANQLLVKRVGTPEDVAATALYLMESGYTTGTVVNVDGGGALI